MEVSFRADENGKKFPFVDVGSEAHGRKSFRLWVAGRLVVESETSSPHISFPVKGKIEKTGKGSLVLRPSEDHVTHNVFIRCGYRGGSRISILSPEGAQSWEYAIYSSQLGSTGVSSGMLVSLPSTLPLKYKWERTGRLYGGESEGITIVMPDGSSQAFEAIPDGLEALDELKELSD